MERPWNLLWAYVKEASRTGRRQRCEEGRKEMMILLVLMLFPKMFLWQCASRLPVSHHCLSQSSWIEVLLTPEISSYIISIYRRIHVIEKHPALQHPDFPQQKSHSQAPQKQGTRQGKSDSCRQIALHQTSSLPIHQRLDPKPHRIQKILNPPLQRTLLLHQQPERAFPIVHQQEKSEAHWTIRYALFNADAKKKFLVLDLDETLIHSVFTGEKTDVRFTHKGD